MGPSGNGLVERMKAGESPWNQGRSVKAAPVRFQKAVPRSKENAAVERRKARRSALWAGCSLPLEGQVRSQDGPTGAAFRAREFRRSASLFLGLRRVRNRQFGTTVRRDAPRGNAPARVNTVHAEGTITEKE